MRLAGVDLDRLDFRWEDFSNQSVALQVLTGGAMCRC